MRQSIALILVMLWSLPASAECEGRQGRLDYHIPNQWLELSSRKWIEFKDVCDVHDACYRVLRSDREFCDEQFKTTLDETCDEAFEKESTPNSKCHRVVNVGLREILYGADSGAYWRKVQRAAKRMEEDEQRAEREEERRRRYAKRSEERRLKRQKQAYQRALEAQRQATQGSN